MDYATPTDYLDVRVTFSQPVFNVSFNIADIDRLTNTMNNYFDKITVTGYIGALSGSPTITKYDAVTDPNFMFISGNTAYVNTASGMSGNSASDAADQKGTIRVRFGNVYITSFVVRYANMPGVLADPTVQNIAIGNISFQKSVPLPTKLLSFTGGAHETGNLLNWTATNEENFDFYGIERSEDGVSYREIGRVSGKGAVSASSYQYKDVTNGGKFFYRLKLVDADGVFTYSQVVVVESGFNKEFRAYPTAFSRQINVVFRQSNAARLELAIYTMAGQRVHQQYLNASEGLNQLQVIPPSHLANGQYLLCVDGRKYSTIIRKQ
jgi:hypothetical protein